MGLQESLRKFDSHSSVSKEFRVYTIQGAVLSVVTVIGTYYLLGGARYNDDYTLFRSFLICQGKKLF